MTDQENNDNINKNEVTVFGKTTFRNNMRTFGIKTDDRRRHVYAIGKTGMGKTVLLENMIYSDIMKGHGCCYVDPHGDTAESLLNCIPSNRINDVIYFNPADIDYPISFNVLEKVDPRVRHLIASGLVGVFKKLWADSWGPRLEYILRNTILALLDYPGSTLLGINRMLVDKEYNKKVVDKITDPVVKAFWVDEYPKWNERMLQEVISPIQNKVGQFLSTALIRNIVGQVTSTLDIRKIMDEKKILILNLSKGRIGEDASALLGAMIITKIQLAAMSRVDIPEEERNDFYLYVDEFQNFVTEAFADILSEARKYRLCLTLAHQYIEQLGEVVGPAVFGNVGTIINFRVGAADAEFLVKEYEPFLLEEDLVSIPKYNFYCKLMIDGITSDPFSAIGLPPLIKPQGFDEKIITVSRERYAKSREVVEDKIRRWAESSPTSETSGSKDKVDKDQEGDFSAACDGCSKDIKVKFQPDNVRATYCSDCLKKMRNGELPSLKPKAKAGTEVFSGPKPENLSGKPQLPVVPVVNEPVKETKSEDQPKEKATETIKDSFSIKDIIPDIQRKKQENQKLEAENGKKDFNKAKETFSKEKPQQQIQRSQSQDSRPQQQTQRPQPQVSRPQQQTQRPQPQVSRPQQQTQRPQPQVLKTQPEIQRPDVPVLKSQPPVQAPRQQVQKQQPVQRPQVSVSKPQPQVQKQSPAIKPELSQDKPQPKIQEEVMTNYPRKKGFNLQSSVKSGLMTDSKEKDTKKKSFNLLANMPQSKPEKSDNSEKQVSVGEVINLEENE